MKFKLFHLTLNRISQHYYSFLFSIFIFLSFINVCRAQTGKTETGIASYYHDKFIGRLTASGEIFSQEKFTAAHKTMRLNTWVKVTNLINDSVVIVKVNDRLPPNSKRTIDLTEAAAKKLNFLYSGLVRVKIEIVSSPENLEKEFVKQRQLINTTSINTVQVKSFKQADMEPVTLKYPRIKYIVIEEKNFFQWLLDN